MPGEIFDDSVPCWPSGAEACKILRVSEAAFSRLRLPSIPAGGREKRHSPESILEAAEHFKRVPLRLVADELVKLARKKYADCADIVEDHVETYLRGR